jgi:hypothetical protein
MAASGRMSATMVNEVGNRGAHEHLQGALAPVKLRGDQQFQNGTGLRMFTQLCDNVVLGCLEWEVDVPEEVLMLRAQAARFVPPQDLVRWRFAEVMVRYARLTGSKSAHLSEAVVLEARELDSELQGLAMLFRGFPLDHSTVQLQRIVGLSTPTATPDKAGTRSV